MKLYKLAFIAAGVAAISSAQALSIVTNRAALGANDGIDFGQFGPAINNIANPSLGTTNLGSLFLVSSDAASFTRYDQGTLGNGPWFGNFNPGDHLLYASDNANGGAPTMVFDFAQTYMGFGLQIMNNFYGKFTAQVQAYDGLGNLLGTFTENGVSNGNSDNSAIFLGVKDNTNDIAEVRYSVVASDSGFGDFAVNQATIQTCSTVPEPCSLFAIATGVVGLVRRRGRKA